MLLSPTTTTTTLRYSRQPEQRSRWLSELAELIAFPTISALPRHRRDIKAAAQSMRLVPNQEPGEIARLLRRHITAVTPPAVRIHLKIAGGLRPVLLPRRHPVMLAATRAVQQTWRVPPVFTRSGGSIPLVEQLHRRLQVAVVLLGFGLLDDNIHAPNEKISLSNFFQGIETVIRFLAEYAA